MKLKTLLIAAISIAVLAAGPAYAGKDPRPGSADSRIKTFTYHETEVYQLKGHYGFSTVIEFSPRERIETVSMGDSEAWQVLPTKSRPNILLIKPLEENAQTNMTVMTTKRIYTFDRSDKFAFGNPLVAQNLFQGVLLALPLAGKGFRQFFHLLPHKLVTGAQAQPGGFPRQKAHLDFVIQDGMDIPHPVGFLRPDRSWKRART